MKFTGEVQVIPIGTGVSVRSQVKRAHDILRESGLHVELHAQGTNVEGEMRALFAAIERIHEELHASGTVRLATFVKLGTRTDREPTLQAKLF